MPRTRSKSKSKSRRRSSRKSKSSKSKSFAMLGEIKTEMFIQPSIGKKAKWVKLPPYLGTIKEFKNCAATGFTDEDSINEVMVKLWFMKLRKQRAVKIAFINLMQNCLFLSYQKKLPSWFNKKIKSNTPSSFIKDYYQKAKRILACYLLYRNDATEKVSTKISKNDPMPEGSVERRKIKF